MSNCLISWSSHCWAASFPAGSNFVHIRTNIDTDTYGSALIPIENAGYTCQGNLTFGFDLLDVQMYGKSGDLLLWSSHGAIGAVAVELFSTELQAKTRKDLLGTNFYQGDLVYGWCPEAAMWFVGLTNQGIENTLSASVATVAACYSTTTAGHWASHEVGYADKVTQGDARADMTDLFDNLTAKDDYDTMTVASAIRAEQTLMNGNGNIALLPWVVSHTPPDGPTNQQYVTVNLTFGGPMTWVNFTVGGYGIKNSQGGGGNSWWVRYQTGWAVGDVVVGILSWQGISSNGIALKEDWTHNWLNTATGYPPAASVASFTPYLAESGVRIYTDLCMMRGSKVFWVERKDGSIVGDSVLVERLSGHEFEVFDPGAGRGQVYRLLEQDKRNRVFVRAIEGVFETKPKIVSNALSLDVDGLRQRLMARSSILGTCSNLVSSVGLIICPDSMATYSQILANFWQSHGLSVVVKRLSETGGSREEIKSFIQQAYANGIRYVLLAGSASDCEWFDDPSKWPDLPGDDDWYYWYQDYHTPGGYVYLVSQASRNLIPTWFFPDTTYDNMSYWTPYYSGDWHYAEGLPELRIGRLPAANRYELLSMIGKEIDYVEEYNANPWQNSVSVWGFCQSWDGNNGPLMKALALDFMSQIPESYQTYALLDTSWTYAQREGQGLADWNGGRGIIWMMGTSSTAYKPNQFFSKSGGWSVSKHEAGKLTLLIGASCGIGAYDLAQDVIYGEPVAQELLTSDPTRGAWAVIAPTRGTWIEGDRQMYQLLNHYLCVEPVQDLGTAFMLAQREVRQGEQSMCAESYNLLGDPMAPLPGKILTDVADVAPRFPTLLHQNYPNPFNPITIIEYSLEARSYVNLRVYDVAGRLENVLVDGVQEMGQYRLGWDGRDSQGRSLASGVYFCRLQADSFFQTRKMILLK